MNDPVPSATEPVFVNPFHVGLHALRRNWGWFLTLGVLMLVLGTGAILFVVAATITATLVFGYFLLFDAGFQALMAVYTREWSGFFIHLSACLLSAIVGLMIVTRPLASAEVLTLMLAIYFVLGGLFRLVAPLVIRFPSWGWSVFVGLIDLFLGLIIWGQWPVDGSWVIGTFVGIGLIFRGWSFVMFALAVRQLPSRPA